MDSDDGILFDKIKNVHFFSLMPNSLTFNDLDIDDNGFTSSVLSDKKRNEILCNKNKKETVSNGERTHDWKKKSMGFFTLILWLEKESAKCRKYFKPVWK